MPSDDGGMKTRNLYTVTSGCSWMRAPRLDGVPQTSFQVKVRNKSNDLQ